MTWPTSDTTTPGSPFHRCDADAEGGARSEQSCGEGDADQIGADQWSERGVGDSPAGAELADHVGDETSDQCCQVAGGAGVGESVGNGAGPVSV
jgi:hypothetical protein